MANMVKSTIKTAVLMPIEERCNEDAKNRLYLEIIAKVKMQQFSSRINFIIIFLIAFFLPFYGQNEPSTFINPTGEYDYDGKTVEKNGETYGYFGGVKVLLLDNTKLLMSFSVCKGAPSYNSGSFVDTLSYNNNQSVYFGDTTMLETTCRVVFYFSKKGINVEQYSDYPNSACGFGHAVDAQGFYKKIDGAIPTKEDILKEH